MKHFEFWPPRVLEIPYFLYLAAGSVRRGLPPKFLAKANYALDHGEIGFGSKLQTQLAFNQDRFLPTELLQGDLAERAQQAQQFARTHGYPVVLKPDRGRVGKGIVKAADDSELGAKMSSLSGAYLIQKYTTNNVEFGVFFVRHQGRAQITGINQKHFPTVVGDGQRSIGALALAHARYSENWQAFLSEIDIDVVPNSGETVQLSFIGSHTLGCKFTNDTHKLTEGLAASVAAICESQPGFNFGRFDVKAASESDFYAGDFVVIEVNGIASLPTHMFDPEHSLRQGYRIFFEHGRHLLNCANEQRHQTMALDSWPAIFKRLRASERNLQAVHEQLSNR